MVSVFVLFDKPGYGKYYIFMGIFSFTSNTYILLFCAEHISYPKGQNVYPFSELFWLDVFHDLVVSIRPDSYLGRFIFGHIRFNIDSHFKT